MHNVWCVKFASLWNARAYWVSNAGIRGGLFGIRRVIYWDVHALSLPVLRKNYTCLREGVWWPQRSGDGRGRATVSQADIPRGLKLRPPDGVRQRPASKLRPPPTLQRTHCHRPNPFPLFFLFSANFSFQPWVSPFLGFFLASLARRRCVRGCICVSYGHSGLTCAHFLQAF